MKPKDLTNRLSSAQCMTTNAGTKETLFNKRMAAQSSWDGSDCFGHEAMQSRCQCWETPDTKKREDHHCGGPSFELECGHATQKWLRFGLAYAKTMETHRRTKKIKPIKALVLSVVPAQTERGTADNLTNRPTITIVFWLCRLGFGGFSIAAYKGSEAHGKLICKRFFVYDARARTSVYSSVQRSDYLSQ